MPLDELDIQRIATAVVTLLRNEQCLFCKRIGSIYPSMCEHCGNRRYEESLFSRQATILSNTETK